MKITRKIDTTDATYDLLDLSHAEMMRIYQGLHELYIKTHHRPIDEIEEELPKKIVQIIKEAQITI